MIQFYVFPGGKKRVVTFSYDDGDPKDARLIELFNTYGVKGTFHLNGIHYQSIDEAEKARLRKLYAGHEVACHTLRHGYPALMPNQSVVEEVLEDRKALESVFGYPVIGMSYPCESYNDNVVMAMQSCGIVYSRAASSTNGFVLPADFMRWQPTCHHKNALAACQRFLDKIDSKWFSPLLYIWGHSHELVTEEQWEQMEQILTLIGKNDKIWYATNIEIYNYMTAQRHLQISADEKVFYNPSAIDVWVERNKKDIICIPAGQTITVE